MSVQKGNIFLPLISAIAVLALLAAGYFFLQTQQLQQAASSQKQIKSTPVPTPAPTVNQDETVNWKTYVNSKVRYQFKYDPKWHVVGNDDYLQVDDQTINPNYEFPTGIEFTLAPLDMSNFKLNAPVGSRAEIGNKIFEEKISIIQVGGVTAIKYRLIVLPDSQTDARPGLRVKIPSKEGMIIITTPTETEKYSRMLDQILSTFKFTEK